MSAPPSVAPFVAQIADLAADLRRGSCCLVVCDKGWTLPLFANLKERLKAVNVRCGFLDGRPTEKAHADLNTMLAAVAQMRYMVRAPEMDGVVCAIPFLDIMASTEGGWNNISREVVPLLYENPNSVWLGFQDPTLPLLPLVEKVFTRRYVIEERYRTLETVAPPPPPPIPALPTATLPVEEAREPEPDSEMPPPDLPQDPDAPPP
jgi:cell division protease FtsH